MKENITLLQGDCLELMQTVKSGSVDMVLCDLPYGTMKGADLNGWDNSTTYWDERIDTKQLFDNYERVLRKNGIVVLFSQEHYTSYMRTYRPRNLKFAYPLVWVKDHFANPLSASKAPVSYFEDMNVYYKEHDTQLSHPLREYFEKVMEYIGCKSCKEVNKLLGHRKAEHTFYCGTSQFSLCAQNVYQELIEKFSIDKMGGFKDYGELKDIDKKIKEKYARTFNLQHGQKHMSNVLEFKKDYGKVHPTQKPVALLERLIETYTNAGDTVMDNCMGSGSTGVACVNTGRKFIGMELDENYFRIAQERITGTQEMANKQLSVFDL